MTQTIRAASPRRGAKPPQQRTPGPEDAAHTAMRSPKHVPGAVLLTTVLMGALSIAALPSAGAAQTPPADRGGTLGIDCEKPRRNAQGKLILGDDGGQRARCEADRATALTYAGVVRETRDRLRAALTVLPPPLRDDLVTHLRTDDAIGTWRYADADIMARLRTLSAADGDFANIHPAAKHWADGLLTTSSVGPDWRGAVRARACGTGPSEVILVWLDPDVIRDRWSPEMVQRTVRTWLERTEGPFVMGDHIPDIVTGTRRLRRPDGRLRDISANPACFATVPEGALAMRLGLGRDTETGRSVERCLDPDQVGTRRLMWTRRNGVYIVPETAILDDGSPHPDRGQPLINPPVTREEDAVFPVAATCRAPRTLDAVRTAPCDAEINGQPVRGTHVRSFRFREVQTDPHEPFRIDMVPVNPAPGNPLGAIAAPGTHMAWEETTLFCEGAVPPSDAPDIPPRVPADWGYPDCRAAHGGRFNEGDRQGYRQTIAYDASWPVDEVEVRTIDDDCFRAVRQEGEYLRLGPICPAGYYGVIMERRVLSWFNRVWAVPSRHSGEGSHGIGDVVARWKIANPDEDAASASYARAWFGSYAGVAEAPWYDLITLEQDWAVSKNTCARDKGRNRDVKSKTGWDVDDDSRPEFFSQKDFEDWKNDDKNKDRVKHARLRQYSKGTKADDDSGESGGRKSGGPRGNRKNANGWNRATRGGLDGNYDTWW